MWALLSFAIGIYVGLAVWLIATGATVFNVIPAMIVVGFWIFVTYRINKKLEFKVRED
tara:strand:- start:439 stop:612 length:174 start_codon:yes stop_codon:yes gene_type:complete